MTTEFRYDDDGDGTPDRAVHVLMLNRQSGAYQYRILTFDPLSRAIEVKTYSLENASPGPNAPGLLLENMF